MSAPAEVLSADSRASSRTPSSRSSTTTGYPLSVAADFQVDAERGVVTLSDRRRAP